MAQTLYIPILDDGLILQASPLVILDTLYYEMWYNESGTDTWIERTELSPLPLFVIGSPATSQPCMTITMLPAATTYNFRVRRFNSDGKYSNWVNGTFTT